MEENKQNPEIKISKGGFLTWLENFWYHYKWPTIIITVALIMVCVCLWQVSTTEKHDTVIVYAGPNYLSTSEIRQLEEIMSTLLPSDRDGNKEKNAAMSMYQIYSEKQIENSEYDIDPLRNTKQFEEYNNYMMTGESSLCLVDPHLYEKMPEEYKYPLSELFGEALPKGAIDGYGIRLGDTDLYKDYGIVRLLPADTVIYLKSPLLVGASADEERYQFEKDTFIAIVTYSSQSADVSDASEGASVAFADIKKREAIA